MLEEVSPLDLRKRLGDILNRVSLRQDQYLVVRKGKPLAAVVPVEKLDWLERASRQHVLALLGRQESDLDQQKADALADQAKHESRRARDD